MVNAAWTAILASMLPLPWLAVCLALTLACPPAISGAEPVVEGIWSVDAHGAPQEPAPLVGHTGQVAAEDNANTAFSVCCWYPKAGNLAIDRYVLRIGSDILKPSNHGESTDTWGIWFNGLSAEQAARTAALLKIPLQRRNHPGYRLDAWIVPHVDSLVAGGALEVDFIIRNVGEQSFHYLRGGHQRGPRDDQFHVAADGPDGSLAMKEAIGFGGLSSLCEIAPGAELTQTLSLAAWFDAKPGYYTVRICYDLPISASGVWPQGVFFPDWEDTIARSCRLRIPAKP